MATNITDPIFHDEAKALAHIEASRWNGTPFCPHCGSLNVHRMAGKTQAGMFLCNDCRDKFTVRTGSVMERSHVPLHKWLLATHLMAASKKGMSAHQLHRMLGVTYKTAWFMAHRIREAMTTDNTGDMGSGGGMVEVDETFIGRVPGDSKMAINNMNKVVSLVDRATGRATSIVFEGSFSAKSIGPILAKHIAPDAVLMTDGAHHYKTLGHRYSAHHSVDHSGGEYVRKGDATIHTNTIEGFFGIFKRGMKGVYQHCGSQHLQRYLAEFDFRYSNRAAMGVDDDERAEFALVGAMGKRLTYRRAGPIAA